MSVIDGVGRGRGREDDREEEEEEEELGRPRYRIFIKCDDVLAALFGSPVVPCFFFLRCFDCLVNIDAKLSE